MKDLNALRDELDGIDREIVALFERRMGVVREIASVKEETGLPVRDPAREERVLATRRDWLTDRRLAARCDELMRTLMRLSRDAQREWIGEAKSDA